ncbi:hypothetical protein NC651_005527 [Populus alba x Populus x berolinensis]|nr:hypothetical protein NC651_005527 [Populus alba x Populus x berolinensis]
MALTKEGDGVKGESKHDSIWIPWRSPVMIKSDNRCLSFHSDITITGISSLALYGIAHKEST